MNPELSYLLDAATAHGIDASRLLIERVECPGTGAAGGLSALRYGDMAAPVEPRVALLHGGGQNAHTWDLVMAALDVPGIALDLPGHGRSAWTIDHDHDPRRLAPAAGHALRALAPDVPLLVGMSVGGMVAVAMAESLTASTRLALIDVSPGSVRPPTSRVGAAAQLPDAPLEELVRQVQRLSPERDLPALTHSVWHATRPVAAGRRAWRADPDARIGSFQALWPDLERLADRLDLVLAEHDSFVPPTDLARLRRLIGSEHIHLIPGSTHSVQSTQPKALAVVLGGLLGD